MILNNTFHFLTELKANNNREWFDANRKTYESCRDEFLNFTENLIIELQQIDKRINTQTPKDCMFRIFRDVRFAKDKSPYKTNFGSHIAPGGRKSNLAGYYIHIEPGASFVGGGIHCPQPNVLKAVRDEILSFTDEFKSILSEQSFQQYYPEIYGERLKNPPRGFPKDHEATELLKHKEYTVIHPLSDEEVQSGNVATLVVDGFQKLKPFNDFLNRAVDFIE